MISSEDRIQVCPICVLSLLILEIKIMNTYEKLVLCTFFLLPTFSLRVGGQGVGWTASQLPQAEPP